MDGPAREIVTLESRDNGLIDADSFIKFFPRQGSIIYAARGESKTCSSSQSAKVYGTAELGSKDLPRLRGSLTACK